MNETGKASQSAEGVANTTNHCGVVYFTHGSKHLVRLVVSIYSLRCHYSGPITILATPESLAVTTPETGAILNRIHDDARLNVEVKCIPITNYRRHSCYVRKASLWRESPYTTTIFLDADTVIAGDITPMFGMAESHPGIVLTRFADWHTHGSIIGGRVKAWENVVYSEGVLDVQWMVRECLKHPLPAINTGVLAWSRWAKFLPAWERLTTLGRRHFICDEIAAQLLTSAYKHTLLSDAWNRSPIYGHTPPEKVVVWHAHGGKHVHPAALPIWGKVYGECLEQDIARLASWPMLGDRRLAGYFEKFGMEG